MLKHDQAYSVYELTVEESMCVIIKCITMVLQYIEMARITKNSSACCAVSANLVRMLPRTASKHN